MNERVLPSSLAEARSAGSLLFFTGAPCRNGHVAPRYTKSNVCRDCISSWKEAHPGESLASRRRSYEKYKRSTGVGDGQRCRAGSAAEYAAASELLSRGCVPFFPATHDTGCDFIVQTPANDKVGVQVKLGSLRRVGRNGSRQYTFNDDGKKSRSADFYVIVTDEDFWIIPTPQVTSSYIGAPYADYRNAWHLITGEAS